VGLNNRGIHAHNTHSCTHSYTHTTFIHITHNRALMWNTYTLHTHTHTHTHTQNVGLNNTRRAVSEADREREKERDTQVYKHTHSHTHALVGKLRAAAGGERYVGIFLQL